MGVRLVVFGRQGAGKGTQCERLVEHYGAVHISTGDMLRAAVAAGSELGLQAQKYLGAGELVPDEVMVGVVRERLHAPDVLGRGYLLDGFPRTLGQAEALLATDVPIDVAVNILVPLDIVRERMAGRGRADDTPEVIERRLATYTQETEPAIAQFANEGLLVEVNGVGSVDEVFDRIVAAVDGHLTAPAT